MDSISDSMWADVLSTSLYLYTLQLLWLNTDK